MWELSGAFGESHQAERVREGSDNYKHVNTIDTSTNCTVYNPRQQYVGFSPCDVLSVNKLHAGIQANANPEPLTIMRSCEGEVARQ